MSKKKNKNACCECCDHCIPMGEGDHMCDAAGTPKVVISDYAPAENYFHCQGHKFKK